MISSYLLHRNPHWRTPTISSAYRVKH